MTLRYLLDEHVLAALTHALRRRGPTLTVWRIGDAGLPARATADPAILEWCEEYQFVLVTNNRRTMPVHLAAHLQTGRHVPGIFILNPQMSVGETVIHLIEVASASLDGEHRDQIKFFPL